MVVDAEVKRMDEKREEVQRISSLWFWLAPALMWFGFTAIIVAMKYIVDDFIGWWNIVALSFMVLGLGQGAGWLIYYFKRNKPVEVKEKVPVLNHSECHNFIVAWARRNPPYVNLCGWEGDCKIAGVRSCGSPSTQVYVEKFINAAHEHNETYYFFMRPTDPDISINYKSFSQPLTKELEDAFVQRGCEDLAISPKDYREHRLERTSALTGVTEIATSREPLQTSVKDENPEQKKEDIEA